MILVITYKEDFTADYLINIMNNRGISYRRFNCEDILNTKLTISYGNDYQYSLLGEIYEAVWFRRTKLPELAGIPSQEQHYLSGEVDSLLKNLFCIIDAKWVSNPTAVYKAENKLFQLKVAQELGFTIPETIVTTSRQAIVDFFHFHKEIIVKPIGRTRIESGSNTQFIFTNKVSQEHISKIEEYDLTPCIFQRLIPKDVELRITVVGEKVFAAQVNSQEFEETKIDWRKKYIRFTECNIPRHIEDLCIALVKQMGLSFGAIDMILSPDGTYTFLEINPNGQWVWIETETGLSIADALLSELLNPKQ